MSYFLLKLKISTESRRYPPREIKAVFYCIVFFSDIIVNTMQSLKYAM